METVEGGIDRFVNNVQCILIQYRVCVCVEETYKVPCRKAFWLLTLKGLTSREARCFARRNLTAGSSLCTLVRSLWQLQLNFFFSLVGRRGDLRTLESLSLIVFASGTFVFMVKVIFYLGMVTRFA